MNITRPLIENAIRLLNISDSPDLYHRLRRYARARIKHLPVDPIDTMNWKKGCLMCGLMHCAESLSRSEHSSDRALSILAEASVQEYLDRWLAMGAPIYMIDDVLAAQALLSLAELYVMEEPKLYERYAKAARGVMNFLYGHDTDAEGVLPYRPAQGTGQIFADGIGMAVPFMMRFGLMMGDEDALELGVRQIRGISEHMIDDATGLPWHVYSLKDEGPCGALGWGRALGWILYGLRASAEAFERYDASQSPMAISARKVVNECLDRLCDTARHYRRGEGLYGSMLTESDSPIDTSASAMIIYGLGHTGDREDAHISPLIPYIGSDGSVAQAQGECMGIGIYSDTYDSYPWSVGTTLMLI